MAGLWISNLALWVAVLTLGVLMVGVLRNVGVQGAQGHREAPNRQVPSIARDGPDVGTPIPEATVETAHGPGAVNLAQFLSRDGTLVVFLSPLCRGCQMLVAGLNAIHREETREVRIVAIVQGPRYSCDAFLSVFPLDCPVVADEDHSITNMFGVVRTPFALLYDENGTLKRKGVMEYEDDTLLALLGDPSASAQAQADVFP